MITISLCFALGTTFALSTGVPTPDHGKSHHHPVHYHYGYEVHSPYHGTKFGHREAGDGHNTKGQYYVHLPDGRLQTVHYNADHYKGYVANVKYSKGHHVHKGKGGKHY